MADVDRDIQSVFNTLVSRARAAVTHLQDREMKALDEEGSVDLEYRHYWTEEMLNEMVALIKILYLSSIKAISSL
jgi:hypothetical protein